MFRSLFIKLSGLKRKQKFVSFYKQFVKPGDLCFDIGANIGHRSGIFLSLGAKVIAVEPVQESINVLKQRFGQKNKMIILQAAIGSNKGQSTIHISNELEVCTLSEKFIAEYKDQPGYDLRWEETRTTNITTLDQLIQDHGIPSFCKIDVEGYEVEVLKGLSQPLPLLSFEYNAKLKKIALNCLEMLAQYEHLTYNFSPYETMSFTFDTWQNITNFKSIIKALPETIQSGDIYVKGN